MAKKRTNFWSGALIIGVFLVWIGSGDESHHPSSNTVPQQDISAPLAAPQIETSLRPEPEKQPTVPKTTMRQLYVDASRLNVRDGPSRAGKIVWTLKRDEAVRVLRRDGDWSYLESARYRGWVFSTYLTPKKSPQKTRVARTPKRSTPNGLTTAAIKKLLIQRSKAYYSGSCPCPYNSDRAGRRCGGRSAYSRPGGASPLCFNHDVSAQMVADFRARQ